MFESTLPAGTPDLMRVSAFQRYLDELSADSEPGSSRLSQLNPSVLEDLLRFEQDGRQTELLEVLAASVRHAKPLTIHLQSDDKVLPLTVFPVEQLAHCPLALPKFLELRLSELVVMHVEAGVLNPPGHPDPATVGEPVLYGALGPVTWELALRGNRSELLPEISRHAAFRIPPGVELQGLEIAGSLAAAVYRMKRDTTNLKEMSAWPGFDRERAMRLLNALYLQAGLMITRTHPAATNDGWVP